MIEETTTRANSHKNEKSDRRKKTRIIDRLCLCLNDSDTSSTMFRDEQ